MTGCRHSLQATPNFGGGGNIIAIPLEIQNPHSFLAFGSWQLPNKATTKNQK
jgi:hypothetical protein